MLSKCSCQGFLSKVCSDCPVQFASHGFFCLTLRFWSYHCAEKPALGYVQLGIFTLTLLESVTRLYLNIEIFGQSEVFLLVTIFWGTFLLYENLVDVIVLGADRMWCHLIWGGEGGFYTCWFFTESRFTT